MPFVNLTPLPDIPDTDPAQFIASHEKCIRCKEFERMDGGVVPTKDE